MFRRGEKRGLSAVVATLLIILLAMILIVIVWVVIRGNVKDQSDEISLDKFTVNLKISDAKIIDDTHLNTKIIRNVGEGDIYGVYFVVHDIHDSEVARYNISMKELEEKKFEITLYVLNASEARKITLAPIIKLNSGKEVVGSINDEFLLIRNEGSGSSGSSGGSGSSGSGGSGSGSSGSGGSTPTPTCTETCSSLDYECGTHLICDEEENCGTCGNGYVCNNNGKCVEESTCVPTTCEELERVCGEASDGCGKALTCGICNDNNLCTEDSCSQNGKCVYSSTSCDDNNECTTDVCDPSTGCSHASLTGISCKEDNNPCTTDICNNGLCTHIPISDCCTTNSQCGSGAFCPQDRCNLSDNKCYSNYPSCTNNDGCCPLGCNLGNDNDCTTCTGNSQCNDNNVCTTDTCVSGTCTFTPITQCINNDGCCPTGCNAVNDNNCNPKCGNGVREGSEQCDGLQLGSATCVSLLGSGYTSGSLTCTSGCIYNVSNCCSPESNTQFCSRLTRQCGSVTANDNCGNSRTVSSCGTCQSGYTCSNGLCIQSCVPETNAQFCSRLTRQCGSVTANDNCGNSRTVSSCGTCQSGYTCSNGLCIQSCVPETNAQFCSRLGKDCGNVTGVDNCGNSKTVNCGSCSSPLTCGGNGTANVCGCTVSSYTPALNTFCGSRSVTTNCGTTVTMPGTLTCQTGYSCAANGTCVKDSADLKYLVQNGVGYADIIVASNAPNTVKLAGNYFQMYIQNMTGVRLPISNTINNSKQYHVYIGKSSYTDSLGINSNGCEYDGFKIISGSDYLVLIGDDEPFTPYGPTSESQWDALTGGRWENNFINFYQKQRNPEKNIWRMDGMGSMNAVFEFLYDQGIRWYAPGDIGVVIPNKQSVGFRNTNVLKNPDYPMRSIFMYYMEFGHLIPYLYPDYENRLQWALSLRLNNYFEFMDNPAHGILEVIERSVQRTNHPEYYAILNGVRRNGENPVPDLCSQELLQENVLYVKAMFDLYNFSVVSVMPTDGFEGPSESSQRCLATRDNSRGWESALSNYVWDYVNNVSWEIYNDPKYAGKKISNCAYPPYLYPPTKLSKPVAPNLVVILTQWRSNFASEEENRVYKEVRNQWINMLPSKEVYSYDYYLHNRMDSYTQGVPTYFPHMIVDDLKELKSNSKGEFMEVYSNWPPWNLGWDSFAATSLNIYITSRAYWDVNLDVDLLLEEYYPLYYGPASSQMKAFVEYSEANYVYALENPNVLRTMRTMLTNARATAGNTVYGQRIDLLIGLMNSNFAGEVVNVNSCRTLNSPATTYVLTSDVSSSGTCFIVDQGGIILDCQGHTITYSGNGMGIGKDYWYTAGSGLVIKNCNIVGTGTSSREGIQLEYTNNVRIENTNITSRGNGISLFENGNISIVNTRVSSSGGQALFMQSANGGLVNNSVFSSASDWGIYLYDTQNLIVTWNNVTGRANGNSVQLTKCTQNTITDNRFSRTGVTEYQSSGNILLRNTVF